MACSVVMFILLLQALSQKDFGLNLTPATPTMYLRSRVSVDAAIVLASGR